MADWSVQEQTIPTTAVEGAITSIGLRVDHPDTSFMIMDLHAGADTYELRFQRNGAFVGWRKIELAPAEAPPAAASEEEEHHTTRSKKR